MKRTHECMKCKYKWDQEVVHTCTPKLSGEATVYCPKCGSRSIMSGPVHEFMVMEQARKQVQNALRNAIGMLEAEVDFQGGDGDTFDFQILFGAGYNVEFHLRYMAGTKLVRTITGMQVEHNQWVTYARVTKDGGRWDPPYEDDVEVAKGATPEIALIEALLVYFRNAMYDSLPQIDIDLTDIEGDIPQ
jgi:DNA-directed RNA polymerase subunit RPC12/RpoP